MQFGLNVSECEYYALTHGAAHGLGLKAYMADLGFDMSLHIFSDSSAARAFASGRGLGRQRHVHTRYLWLHGRVAAPHLTVQKIKTTQNPADILTKAASRETLERHRKKIGLRHVEAHRSQKELRLESSATDPVQTRNEADTVVRHLWRTQIMMTCRERVQWLNSSDSGTDEVVGSTGIRRIMMLNVKTVDDQELGAVLGFAGVV